MDLLRIIASTPVDNTARQVTSEGVHYSPRIKNCRQFWEYQPKVKAHPRAELELAGIKFARFTVIGLTVEPRRRSNEKCIWVCKCVCGRFEKRTAKAIKNPKNTDDMCTHCQHLDQMKRNSFYKRYGYNL